MGINELRIGNYIKYNETWACVRSIISPFPGHEEPCIELECNGIIDAHPNDIEGIELTSAIVKDFGFKRKLEGLYVNGNYIVSDVLRWSVGLEDNGQWLADIKYLHELQNIYYALTKTELRKENEK